MNRDTILLLAIILALTLALTGVSLAILDAMVLQPEAAPSVDVSGSVKLANGGPA